MPTVRRSKNRSGLETWIFHSSKCSCTLGSCICSLNTSRRMIPSLSANDAQTSCSALASFAFSSPLIFKRSFGLGFAICTALSTNMEVTILKPTTVNITTKKTRMSALILLTPAMSRYRSPQSFPPVVACSSVTMPLPTEPKASLNASRTSSPPSPETMASLVVWTKYSDARQRIKQSSTSHQNIARKQLPTTSNRCLSSREKRSTRSIRRILEALKMRTVRNTDTPCAVMSMSAMATRRKSITFQFHCELQKKYRRCTASFSSSSRM
mmetsp:Transcript_79315/g.224324  ORF Transcript_79315/g.224324 Transcript_79315/m.224324 type:complete len:268 (-) Transcript_79315:1-804(-)